MTNQIPSHDKFADSTILSDVLDVSVHGIIVVDSECHIIVWNQWMKNYSQVGQSQAVGKFLFALFPSLKGKRIDQAINSAIQHGTAAILSHTLNQNPLPLYTAKDKIDPIKQSIFVTPISITDDKRLCAIQIQDVTLSVRREKLLRNIAEQAEQAKQAAEKLTQVKTEFISTVSHELRTPLTSILGSLGLICGGVVGDIPEQAASLASLANKNSEHLLMLINDLLDIDKIESGNMDFIFKNLEVMPFVEESINCNSGFAAKYNVQFKITERLDNIMVSGDSVRLIQVMSNLLSNAAKFSPPNGVVELSVKQADDNIRISVTDYGPGIPEKFHQRLFDKFTQSDSSDTRKVGGTGLGLNIAKAIVEHHNGHINFDTQPGSGSTFYINLPILNTSYIASKTGT